MKRNIFIISILVLLATLLLVSCASKNNETTDATAESDINSADTEYGIVEVPVTDENGEEVTDENGDVVTQEVDVVYTTDSDGNTIAQVIDSSTGETVTNENGEAVTVDLDSLETTTSSSKSKTTTSSDSATSVTVETTKKSETTKAPTTKADVSLTESADTTKDSSGDSDVPDVDDTGDEVNFSEDDQATIISMLEVPYLYISSYDNGDGVPIDIATYTAIWMAEHSGATSTSFASGTVALNLFKYYGQTVVNFKSYCNDAAKECGAPITYNSSSDTYTITSYPAKTHTVTITKIEDLGGNNYYRVTGTVSEANDSGCDTTKVVAVIQKNKLDTSLGFSIKALEWS